VFLRVCVTLELRAVRRLTIFESVTSQSAFQPGFYPFYQRKFKRLDVWVLVEFCLNFRLQKTTKALNLMAKNRAQYNPSLIAAPLSRVTTFDC
jgi:hypothetical protein